MGPEAHPQARTPPRVVARDDQPELAAAVAPSSTLIRGEPHLGAHTAAAFPEERSSARGDPAIPAPRTLRRRTPCPGPSASHPRPLRPRAPVTPTPPGWRRVPGRHCSSADAPGRGPDLRPLPARDGAGRPRDRELEDIEPVQYETGGAADRLELGPVRVPPEHREEASAVGEVARAERHPALRVRERAGDDRVGAGELLAVG